MMMMMMINVPLYAPPLLRSVSLCLSVFKVTASRCQHRVTEQHYKWHTS